MSREYPRLRTSLPEPESLASDPESDRATQCIALATMRVLLLMKGLDGQPVRPSGIGWLSIWSRTVDLLCCARDAVVTQSSLALAACDRVAAELQLHVLLLAKAREGPDLDPGSLGALTVWQLLNDKRRI